MAKDIDLLGRRDVFHRGGRRSGAAALLFERKELSILDALELLLHGWDFAAGQHPLDRDLFARGRINVDHLDDRKVVVLIPMLTHGMNHFLLGRWTDLGKLAD